jgi:hypothetical protein
MGAGVSKQDRAAIAEAVAQRLEDAAEPHGRWLKTAGEAVGLVAAAVALVYLIGGLVFALRLLLDGSSVSEVAALIGQMSRELVITTGFVQALGPAIIVGLAAGMVYATAELPKVPEGDEDWPGLQTRVSGVPTFVALAALAAVLVLPAATLLSFEDRWSIPELVTIAFGFLVVYAAVLVGWYVIRAVVPQRRSGAGRYKAERGLLAGAIWAAFTLPPAILLAGSIGLEQARICLTASAQAIDGRLVASTRDAVLLVREVDGNEAVVSTPVQRIARLDYGLPVEAFAACPQPTGQERTASPG